LYYFDTFVDVEDVNIGAMMTGADTRVASTTGTGAEREGDDLRTCALD